MNLPEVINDLPIQCEKNLSALYEAICDEYRRRLCELWDVPFEESWWAADESGGELCIADAPWGLDMQMIRHIGENAVDLKSFMEWWGFVESEIHNGHCPPRINFYHWFSFGARPDSLKDCKHGAITATLLPNAKD